MSVNIEELWKSFTSSERERLQSIAEERKEKNLFARIIDLEKSQAGLSNVLEEEFDKIMTWVRKMEEDRIPEIAFYSSLERLDEFLEVGNKKDAKAELVKLTKIVESLDDPILQLLTKQAKGKFER